jgi:hypothetical protein
MSIGKTYLDIITFESKIDISTRDLCDQRHVKIKIHGIYNIVLIDVGDKIVLSNGVNELSYTFSSIWSNPSLSALLDYLLFN